jgi:hypothetical protein
MKVGFLGILTLLLLTGCSGQSTQPKYDEVDLIRYQACIDYALSTFGKSGWTYSELVTDTTIEACAKYLPTKK